MKMCVESTCSLSSSRATDSTLGKRDRKIVESKWCASNARNARGCQFGQCSVLQEERDREMREGERVKFYNSNINKCYCNCNLRFIIDCGNSFVSPLFPLIRCVVDVAQWYCVSQIVVHANGLVWTTFFMQIISTFIHVYVQQRDTTCTKLIIN